MVAYPAQRRAIVAQATQALDREARAKRALATRCKPGRGMQLLRCANQSSTCATTVAECSRPRRA
eukprot:12737898-Alexandrium_andersonii.AAC.1